MIQILGFKVIMYTSYGKIGKPLIGRSFIVIQVMVVKLGILRKEFLLMMD